MKSKGGRTQPAAQPAPAPPPVQQPPASPTGKGAKYRNRDGSKFITLPDTTSAPNSTQPSPTSPAPSNAKAPADNASGPTPGVNRKKQKRREKAAAKAAAMAAVNGGSGPSSPAGHERIQELDPADENDDGDHRDRQEPSQQPRAPQVNGHADEDASGKSKKARKKKKKTGAGTSDDGSSTVWNTSSAAERERIKEFWLDLREEERKSLVKVEKDAVLKKMKEQQKHTCSCSVCGRKRNAIEEELEGLYDAYYLELEQFANHPQQDGQPPLMGGARPFGFPPSSRFSSYAAPQPSRGRIVEQLGDDDDDEDDDDELDEPYSDEDLDDDDDAYSDDEPVDNPRDYASDFFNFGSSLTVQGGILTVADDLLKNDGKKFIEMMEQLAERRMAREAPDGVQDPYSRGYGHGMNGDISRHDHPPPPPVDDEEYDEDEDDDYDSQEDDDYEEDDDVSSNHRDDDHPGLRSDRGSDLPKQDTMTEEQRMEEGRRMFQIFAARMFEQRVLQAYREKVAKERQAKLMEEVDAERRREEAAKEKKAKLAQKKKEKKQQSRAAKEEEKARKDEERRAEEEARRKAEQEKAEEARRKAEEKRKQREAQRRLEDEARARKEAERQRQRQEQERKAREAKEREKKAKEERLQKEREAKELKEREARELHEKQEAQRRQKEAETKAAKAEAKASQRQKQQDERAAKKAASVVAATAAQQQQQQQQQQAAAHTTTLPKRPAPHVVNPPALPVLPQHPPATSFVSPRPSIATPALPKALPTPIKYRQASQYDGAAASVSENTSLSQSPIGHTPVPTSPGASAPTSHRGSIASLHSANASQTISPLQTSASRFPAMSQPPQLSIPPAGLAFPPGFQSAAPPGFSAFSPVPTAGGYRPPPGIAPPGISSPLVSRGFTAPIAPPGLVQPLSEQQQQLGSFSVYGSTDGTSNSHSRQPSGAGFESSPYMHSAQPISRPTPIGRPASIVHGQQGSSSSAASKGIDETENHLGSSALLDDSDDVVTTLRDIGRRIPGVRAQPFPRPLEMQQAGGIWGSPTHGGAGMSPFLPTPLVASAPPPPPGFGAHAGWPTPTVHSAGFGTSVPIARPVMPTHHSASTVRQLLCAMCRELALQDSSKDGFVPLQLVEESIKSQVQSNPLGNGPLTADVIMALCETEGTMANGGGVFDVLDDGETGGKLLRWIPDTHQPLGAFGAPGQQHHNHNNHPVSAALLGRRSQ